MNIMSHHFLIDRYNITINTQSMYDYLQILSNFTDDIDSENSSFKFFGITQYRFFQTEEKDCLDDSKLKNADIFNIYFDMTELTCYHIGFKGDEKNKSDIIIGNLTYSDKLDIKHTYHTYNGYFDKTGFVLRYNPFNDTDSKKTKEIIEAIIKSQYNKKNTDNENDDNNGLLGDNIQGIELTFNIYEPNLDLFSAISILVQKSITGNPSITYFDVIPFLTNVYENKESKEL